MMIANVAIRVYGYVPLDRDRKNKVYNYPPSVTASNTYAPLVKASDRNVVVGWYKDDGSYVYIDSSGRASRFDYMNDSSIIDQWDGFSHWLVSEIERLGMSENALN